MNANLRAFSFTQGNHERYCGQKYDEIEWRDVFFGGTFSAFSQGGSFLLDKLFDEKTEFCIFVPLI